jgi:hypothetical protein
MGTYRCGCGVEMSQSSHGVARTVPMCMRHGHGLSLRTVLGRRLFAFWPSPSSKLSGYSVTRSSRS